MNRTLRPLKRIRAVGRGKANLDRLCATARDLGLEAETAETPEQALRDADLVVTSVTLDYTIEPFLDARWLKRGAFAAITDLCIPWHDESLGHFGTVVIDDNEQEKGAERPMLPADSVAGDLADLVTGRVVPRDPEKPAAFAFRGMALGDYAAAVLALRRAQQSGSGQTVGTTE